MESQASIKKLKEKGKRCLLYAKMISKQGDYTWALFMLEQSLQLLLKAKLLEVCGTFPKTHNLRTLLKILSEKIDKVKEFVEKAEVDLLNEAYIVSRYSTTEFGEESFKMCLNFVEELWKILN